MPSTSQRPLDDRLSLRPLVVTPLLLAAIAGVLYPVGATVLGRMLFPHAARGSLLEDEGRVVGSALMGQSFASDRYFHSRPSAAGYAGMGLAGSNWAASNPALRERIAADSQAVARREGAAPETIPTDLVTASGSGSDPHISPAAAYLQAPRVARARGLAEADVRKAVEAAVEPRTFGLLGMPRVNVLALNLALDRRAAGAQ